MPKFDLLATEVVHETPYGRILQNKYDGGDGTIIDYMMADKADAGICIPFDGKRVLFVEQFRIPIKQYSLELPMGGVDPQEDPLEGARRELREETGIVVLPEAMKLVGRFRPFPSFCPITAHAYVAFVTPEQLDAFAPDDPDEAIEGAKQLSLEQVDRAIHDGQIVDGFTLTAWGFFLRNGF